MQRPRHASFLSPKVDVTGKERHCASIKRFPLESTEHTGMIEPPLTNNWWTV